MSDMILTADKKFRKQIIITLAIALPVCVAIFYDFRFYILKIPNGSDAAWLIKQVKSIIIWVSIANGAVSAWLSTRLILMAIHTFKSRRFPPPGMRVIRDTKIQTGRRAKVYGCLLIAAALFVLSTNLVLFFLHQKINGLMRLFSLH
jgi:hypothetical protein